MIAVKFVCLLVFAAVLVKADRVSFLEDARNDNSRIIEGWPAAPNQFSHQVHLRMITPAGGLNSCGGSLIHPQWVLTAAHCLANKNVVMVRLGALNVTTPELVLESKNFFIHPDYNPVTLNNDLGLINLERRVEPSESIRPIRLPSKSAMNVTFAGENATASGYGLTTNKGNVSEVLRFVNLTIIENSKCILDYGEEIIVESTICAVGIQSVAQSTCNGDSGGPLIHYDAVGVPTLIGVVSFVSDEGCDADKPSGYVRPQFFLDWINNSILNGGQ